MTYQPNKKVSPAGARNGLSLSTLPQRISGVLAGTGRGVATAHHGELFQGQIEDARGRLRRCLLSLPCSKLYSWIEFQPDDTGAIRVDPPHKHKTEAAIRMTLEHFKAGGVGGIATIESNIQEGKGYGSSTADCVAAVKAVADALGQTLAGEEIARLVVQAETASDNTMFDHAVLFAQREGVVLEDYARPVPCMEALGIDTDENRIVDTLLYPPASYSWLEIQLFQTLVAALRRAIRTQDVHLLGRVATASAEVNQRFLRNPLIGEAQCMVRHAGALGLAVAHSGTVLSILLDPDDPQLDRQVEFLGRRLHELGAPEVFRFQTRGGCFSEIHP
jgi:uncharacterized protein involved in propanediol utilization